MHKIVHTFQESCYSVELLNKWHDAHFILEVFSTQCLRNICETLKVKVAI